MSITLTIAPIIRPFRGYTDPALPDGYWAAHGGILGDASGGLMSINIRMSASAQPAVSLLWNLEQLVADSTPDTNVTFRLDFGGFDVQPLQGSTGSLTKLIQLNLASINNITGQAMPIEQTKVPIFLGAARKDVNVDLGFDKQNVDGSSFSVFAQGYFWGPAAINAPGGPQRPLTSLYGR